MRFSILVNRRPASLSNFLPVTLRLRLDRQSAATKGVRSKSPKFENRKTVSSTSSPAKSCNDARTNLHVPPNGIYDHSRTRECRDDYGLQNGVLLKSATRAFASRSISSAIFVR